MYALLLCIGLSVGIENHPANVAPPSAPKSIVVQREVVMAPMEVCCCRPIALQGYEYETNRCTANSTAGYVQLFGM